MARAVVESFFNLDKRERIRRRKYKTREKARQDVFDYIEFLVPKGSNFGSERVKRASHPI